MKADELKDLLSKVLGERKIVKDISVTNLLPPGENFMSSILAVQATVRKTSNAKSAAAEVPNVEEASEDEEELHLIAKVTLPADGFIDFHQVSHVFRKEVFFYEEIFPKYRQMLDGTTLKLDIIAQCYGSRLDLKEDKGQFNGCILFENLTSSGYSTGDRHSGVDVEHAKSAIEKLAVFHATGIALKKLRPSEFEGFRDNCANPMPDEIELFETMAKDAIERLEKDDVLRQFLPKYLKSMKPFVDSYKLVSSEPWITIIHMDCWINNMMFRSREGVVDGVKIVDFQTYGLGSPMRDLIRFLFTSVNFEAISMKAIDRLIDFYHERFIEALKILLNCEESNLTEFSRDRFDRQLLEDVKFELLPLIMMNKVILLDSNEVKGDKNDRMSYALAPVNDSCIKKLRKIMAYFDQKHWI